MNKSTSNLHLEILDKPRKELINIAIKKAYVIGRRGEYRDYFDLYTVLKNKYINLPELILYVKKLYGSIFDEKIFLQQLVYFGDLLNFDIVPVDDRSLPKPEEVKSFLEESVKRYIMEFV